MKRMLAITFGLMLIAAPALAGPNPDASLAMHTVASSEYLYCPELSNFDPLHPGYHPMDCTMIDNSAEAAELEASYGYVYVVFLAYNVDCITGVEYCIAGWPTVRGAPPQPLLNYCPEASLILGNPFLGGGIQAFGESVCTEAGICGDVLTFAYFIWGSAAFPTYLPLTLEYGPSAYSYPTNPHNYVLGPAPDFVEDNVVAEFGCTIGGTYHTMVPYWNCPGNTAVEPSTWSNVKAMYR
ncbi:MAG: hypothetical protein KAW17_11320 [Candidatus Eisenbacteria sp.]|nr:hypothetical protein [Candidatus Eisenbacteria bacterium]